MEKQEIGHHKRKWCILLGIILIAALIACVLLALWLPHREDIQISGKNFPNEVFRQYLSELYDKNSDGWLDAEEIAVALVIEIKDEQGLTSLKGIKFLPQLEYLTCKNCGLTELDLSQNSMLKHVYCFNNELTVLKLGKQASLTKLYCQRNHLKELDVRLAPALNDLVCNDNELSTLDVRENSYLQFLDCSNNKILALDVSKNSILRELYCRGNQLTTLDISANPKVKAYCDENVTITRAE